MSVRVRSAEAVRSLHERQIESVTLLCRESVAELWDISIWTVWQRVRTGKMPKPVQFTKGGPHYWRLSDLKHCLDQMQRKGAAREAA